MNYFNIKQAIVNVSPFETITANAIRWVISNMSRGTQVAEANCVLIYVNQDGSINDMLYCYNLTIPKSVLDVWLDDSVIDDYIISQSNGLFEKE